jgi:hypothetical protein
VKRDNKEGRGKMEEFLDKLPQMDLMRSEKMTLVQLIIPVESAHRSITYLGELGLLQFRDLNADKSPFQRTFANQVKRCGEMSRKLRFFKDQIDKAGLRCSPRLEIEPDIALGDLEVRIQFLILFWLRSLYFNPSFILGSGLLFYEIYTFSFASSITFSGRDNLLITSMKYLK